MNSSAAENWNTIMQSHPWSDIRDPVDGAPASPQPEDRLLRRILGAVLAADCIQGSDPTELPEGESPLPRKTALNQNVPNPFNPFTRISFDLSKAGHVRLEIYDVAGRHVRTLIDAPTEAAFGRSALWDGLDDAGRRVSSGVYFYRLEAPDATLTRKLVVMR